MSVYKRGDIWWYRFQYKGIEYRRSSESHLRRDAVEGEKEHRNRLKRKDAGASGDAIGFTELMVLFAEQHWPSLKPSAARRYRVSGKSLIPHFGDTDIALIDRRAIMDYIAIRRREVSDTTIRRDLACLSAAYSFAIDTDRIDRNPMATVRLKKVLGKIVERVRWLRRPAEYNAILKAAQPPQQAIIRILVGTGLRLGELASLEWRNVDLRAKEIHLEKTKTDAPRTVPLSAEVCRVLSAQPRHITLEHVIWTKRGTPYDATILSHVLGGIIRRAGLDDFRPHDLRHTFASWYLQDGGSIAALQRILGHSSIRQTGKYAHLATADLHRDVKRVGTKAGTGTTD